MEVKELQNAWNIYRSIEKDLKESALYVEPYGQEFVYSIAFNKIIINAASLVEHCFKSLCKVYDEDAKCGTITDYKKVILEHNPKITRATVFATRLTKNIKPFKKWDEAPLSWWKDYNEIKHYGADSIKKATCINAITTTAAAYILLLYVTELSNVDATFDDASEYFYCDYASDRVFCESIKPLPGVKKTKKHKE